MDNDPEVDFASSLLRSKEAEIDRLCRQSQVLARERERRELKLLRSGYDFNAWTAKTKSLVATWRKGKIKFYIVKHKMGHFCGYCRFPKRPVKEHGYNGILTYVPVHGGITYARPSPDKSMVYGFDCAHADDRVYEGFNFDAAHARFAITRNEADLMPPVVPRSMEWLRKECETMAAAILICARYESAYGLAAGDAETRARIIDNLHTYLSDEAVGKFNLGNNFGAMINVLSGRL